MLLISSSMICWTWRERVGFYEPLSVKRMADCHRRSQLDRDDRKDFKGSGGDRTNFLRAFFFFPQTAGNVAHRTRSNTHTHAHTEADKLISVHTVDGRQTTNKQTRRQSVQTLIRLFLSALLFSFAVLPFLSTLKTHTATQVG